MVKSLIRLSHVYRDLVKENQIDIDWSVVDSAKLPMTFTREFGFKTDQFEHKNRFKDFDDYLSHMDCKEALTKLQVPTMLVSAKNDPIHTPDIIPWE